MIRLLIAVGGGFHFVFLSLLLRTPTTALAASSSSNFNCGPTTIRLSKAYGLVRNLVFLLLLLRTPTTTASYDCGPTIRLSKAYLSGLVRNSVGQNKTNFVNNFVPSAYYPDTGPGEYKTVKFISTYRKYLYEEQICVDGEKNKKLIRLYDDGTHGDDIANDGVYSRKCIHFCQSYVDYSDYWGYGFEREIHSARLIAVKPSLRGQIPVHTIPNPNYPAAKLLATSHAAFFIDNKQKYFPEWPLSVGDWWDAPSGQAHGPSAILKAFGDVFDFITVSSHEMTKGLPGASTWKWTKWDTQGKDEDEQRIGSIDSCLMAVSGVPIMRMMGGITNIDTVQWMDAQMHEITHVVAGFRYQNALDKARTGKTGHVPGSCTTDHSSLQGPIWDWKRGYPNEMKMGYCANSEDPDDCKNYRDDVVRLVANDDCASCPDNKLSQCCSFRYVDSLATKKHMTANPELRALSPLLQYIAGILPIEKVPPNQVYYCMGPNQDTGCEDDKTCGVDVNDSDRKKVKSGYVTRFTFEELVAANGGPRNPPVRAERDFRHGAVYLGQRAPTDAEIVFYTMMWRHHEIQRQPYGRVPRPGQSREDVLMTWLYSTNGRSTLHSRYHGIPCGGGLQVPSCSDDRSVCNNSPCHPQAICIPLDSRPFCVCPEGLVGDGTVCVRPFQSQSYAWLKSAHELYNDPKPFWRDECFGSDWPKRIPQRKLPPHPGGIFPYAALGCNGTVCAVSSNCHLDDTCVRTATPTPKPPPKPKPNLEALATNCLKSIFDDARCTCNTPGCIETAINVRCMKDFTATKRIRKVLRKKVDEKVLQTCRKPVKPMGNTVKVLVNSCLKAIFEGAKCSCQDQLCIQSARGKCAGINLNILWKRTAVLKNVKSSAEWRCRREQLVSNCMSLLFKTCRLGKNCKKKACIENTIQGKCRSWVSKKSRKKIVANQVLGAVSNYCSKKKK